MICAWPEVVSVKSSICNLSANIQTKIWPEMPVQAGSIDHRSRETCVRRNTTDRSDVEGNSATLAKQRVVRPSGASGCLACAYPQNSLQSLQRRYIGVVKSTRRATVVVSPAVAAKVAAAAARVVLSKEQAQEIAAAEPRHATIFAGSLRKAWGRNRALR